MAAPGGIGYDPYSSEAMSDPWPLYAAMRGQGGPYRLDRYNAWALPCFADVWEVFSDMEDFSIVDGPVFDKAMLEAQADGGTPPPPAGSVSPPDPMPGFVSLDPPVHTALRQAIGGVLRPRPVAGLAEQIRRLARARLARLVPAGGFDVRVDYAGPVSAEVTCLLVGLPIGEADVVQELANASLRRADGRPGLPDGALRARAALDEILLAAVTERRRSGAPEPGPATPGPATSGPATSGPAGGMIDALIAGEFAGRRLTDAEVVTQIRGIVSGGVETVPKVLAGGILELWRSPDQRAAIGAQPEHSAVAFEEMIRFGGPLQWVGRTLRRNRMVAGTPMRAGERLLLLIASANRDEREFPEPDRFIWDRPMVRHLGFGRGHHHCVGTHVARLEGAILLEEILACAPGYHIDEAGIDRPPSEFQIGYTRMPLIVR